MSVVYMTTCFPSKIETFVRDEMQALRAKGLALSQVVSLRKGVSSQALDPEVVDTEPYPVALRYFLLAMLVKPIRFLRLISLSIQLDWRRPFSLKPGVSSLIKSLAMLPLIIELDRRLDKECTHIHAHFAAVATTAACLLASWRGIGFSFTAHGSDIFVYPPKTFATRLARCSFCVTVSQFNANHLSRLTAGRFDQKIHVIHCGIRVREFDVPHRLPNFTCPSFLMVARLDPIKGIDTFLEAIALYKRNAGSRLELKIAGDGPLADELIKLARQLEIEDWVDFLGYQRPFEIKTLLQKADAIVLSSHSEGFPVVLMEAAAARLPMIASRITGIPEILDEGINGAFIVPGDAEQQSEVLKKLAIDNWNLLRGYQKGAAEKLLDSYDLEHTSNQLAGLLFGSDSAINATQSTSLAK
jgi:colanic acid/amylovoran biosynthesis glycosyltransferase